MALGELWFQSGEELKVVLSFSVSVELQCGGFTLEVGAPQPSSLCSQPLLFTKIPRRREPGGAFFIGWSFVLFLLNLSS